jgi:FkbM family methyltransferase
MADTNSARSLLQNALLTLYRKSRRSRLMRSRLGRRLFESAYLAYKILLEAGPVAPLRRFVEPGTWAVDAGANIGMFTLRFSQWVTGAGRVIAIEPEAENFRSLQRRIAASHTGTRVMAIQAVAAEAAGVLRLVVNPDHPGDHKLGIDGVPIAAVTIDAILAEHGNPRVSLMKIDVQGAEMRVLRGASHMLERCHPALFIEVDDAALRGQGSSAKELVNFLALRGYQAHRLRRFGRIEPIALSDLGRDGYEDVLFLRGQASATAIIEG